MTIAYRIIAALWLCVALAGSAKAQGVNYFYCFASDPDSKAVYMSQTLPVGPVSERKNYGQEFADFLLKSGRVRTKVTGYCTMRPTASDIDHSRLMLPSDCSVCGGAEAYQNVAWPRAGMSPQQREMHAVIAAVTPPRPPAVKPPSAAEPSEPEFVLSVIGNAETGELEFGHNEPLKDVMERARAKKATGWSALATSKSAGFGAAFCITHGNRTHFFTSAGQEYRAAALREAFAPAVAYARKVGAKAALCGKWRARFPGAAPQEPESDDYWNELLLRLAREPTADCRPGALCNTESYVAIGVRN
jgi:hypothetical protein